MLCRIADNDSPPAILGTPRLLSSLKQQLGTNSWPGSRRFPLFASCGDMLTPRLVRFAASTLVDAEHHVVNMWIQSESGTTLISTPARKDMQLPGTLGLPMPGISLRNNQSFRRKLPDQRKWPANLHPFVAVNDTDHLGAAGTVRRTVFQAAAGPLCDK